MSYAAVLTHVQADPEVARRLDCALEIAKRFDAALIGVGAEMIPPLAFDGGFYSLEADWTVAMRENIERRLKEAHARFTAAACVLDEKAIWCSGVQFPGAAIAAAARSADIIVTGGAAHRRQDPYRDASSGELALTSGRPVLVAPSHGRALDAKRIVLCWKDSREARRAMADAMPFLQQAETVLVLSICGEADAAQAAAPVEDVVKALQRHGVTAEAKVVTHAHPDGYQVLEQARLADADLIVSGAYGHTRLGEWVFGGFTRDLLSQDECYLLLSH
jgi:nucleotide-binding universal stress UspA family protein